MRVRKIQWAVILCVGAATMAAVVDHKSALAADGKPPAELQKPANAPVNVLPTVESNNQVLKITLASVCGVGVALGVGSWIMFRKRPS